MTLDINKESSRESELRELSQNINLPIHNLTLLDVALTHTSYANEHKKSVIHHNERLEFLGDAVLDLIIGEYLFLQYPQMPEGELTRAKASIVCETSLANFSRKLGYGKYLQLGKGEVRTGGRDRDSILADTFEAIVGAIYLDSDYQKTEEFVLSHLKEALHRIAKGQYDEDYKTTLQEYIQQHGCRKIIYRVAYTKGPDHNKTFCMEALIHGEVYGSGVGKSKKEAEQIAAKKAMEKLGILQ